MLERDLQRAVLDLCSLLHLRTAHFRTARQGERWLTPVAGDGEGFPDLVIVGPRGLLFRELKSDLGALSASQHKWQDALQTAGANWGVWRPRHLLDHTIHNQLKKIAKGPAPT